jgi:outer membrane protein OmpA-like peptidoglycan-associated protein
VLLPYGLELEVDAGVARRPRAEEEPRPASASVVGLDRRRFYTYSMRLLSNWDFGNRSTMFFGGGVALNDRSGAPDRSGATGIVGYRIGEEVALRGDATVVYVPRDHWTDVGFRLGLSVALGALGRSSTVRTGRPAAPMLAITRTVAVTRRDTVYRTDTVYLAAPGGSGPSSPSEVSLPRPRTGDPADASSVVVRFPYNQAVLTSAAKRDLDRWLSAWGSRVAEDSSMRVIVSGFADQCGAPDVNERVSLDRAVATQRYLVDSLHIPADRILARGLGERRLVEVRRDSSGDVPDRPVTNCASPLNRRAEVRAEPPAGGREDDRDSGGDRKVVRRP